MCCFYFLLQMQTCLLRAKSLQKQDQTDPRTPQTQPQPDKCPLGRAHCTNVPTRENTFPLSSWATTPFLVGSCRRGWTHSCLQSETNHLTPSFPALVLTPVSSWQILFHFIYAILFLIFHFNSFIFFCFISVLSFSFYFIPFTVARTLESYSQ